MAYLHIRKCRILENSQQYHWNNFLGPRWSHSWQSAMSADRNLDDFFITVKTLLDNMWSISSLPIPKHQASSGLCSFSCSFSPQTNMIVWPRPIRYLYFLNSLSYKGSLPSVPFCNSQNEDCPHHKVFKKSLFILPRLSSLIIFLIGPKLERYKKKVWTVLLCSVSRTSSLSITEVPVRNVGFRPHLKYDELQSVI